MVDVKDLSVCNWSPSIIFGKSPKITFQCGKCGIYSSVRTNIKSVDKVVCPYCGEINKTHLTIYR